MNETTQLGLPLLQASQAQKHVTVNEALARLDGLVQLVLVSGSVTLPPASPAEGLAWAVPAGAVNAWAGQDGRIAIASNGGWQFVTPAAGWRAFIRDRGAQAVHDGTAWRDGALSLMPSGAGARIGTVEIDQVLGAGPSLTTAAIIPAGAMVFGVTGRVLEPVTGTLASWSLGNPGASGRFGSGLGLGQGSYVQGVLSAPMAFYAATPLVLDAAGGDFAAGKVRLAVHCLELSLPGL